MTTSTYVLRRKFSDESRQFEIEDQSTRVKTHLLAATVGSMAAESLGWTWYVIERLERGGSTGA